ncbi:hypothetical protein [Bacillus thuringiensis]
MKVYETQLTQEIVLLEGNICMEWPVKLVKEVSMLYRVRRIRSS